MNIGQPIIEVFKPQNHPEVIHDEAKYDLYTSLQRCKKKLGKRRYWFMQILELSFNSVRVFIKNFSPPILHWWFFINLMFLSAHDARSKIVVEFGTKGG
jgi:hypothetical protein